MNYSKMQLIKNRIEKMPHGKAFIISDFNDIADYQNVKKCLLRLEQEGFIRRVLRGIYDKPYFSKMINEYSAPNIEEVAKAIARNYNWKIAPSGLTSLNMLGLSTQVTNCYEYSSSGQYKAYQVGKITINFKHKSSKELLDLSYISLLVISAIKEIGQDIDDETIKKIASHLSKEDRDTLLKETSNVTKWIYEVVKRI